MSCLNPNTNRLIKINGPTYKKLIKQGHVNLLNATQIYRYPLLDIFEMNLLILNELNDKDYINLSMTNHKAVEFYNDSKYIHERCRLKGMPANYLPYSLFKQWMCHREFLNGNNVVRIYQLYHPWELHKWSITLNGIEMPYDYQMYNFIKREITYRGITYK